MWCLEVDYKIVLLKMKLKLILWIDKKKSGSICFMSYPHMHQLHNTTSNNYIFNTQIIFCILILTNYFS